MKDAGMEHAVTYRLATIADCRQLAEMNRRLIVDEGHGNRMNVAQLEARMAGFIAAEYAAHLCLLGDAVVGYCLYRRDDHGFYIRQLYIADAYRRHGMGQALVAWLHANVFAGSPMTIEVLSGNAAGIAFWRSLGFADYCITMKRS